MKKRGILYYFKFLLFPFAVLYGTIVFIRNLFFDLGIRSSKSFQIPVIAVGNLSVGGTGKSPQIEYLIRLLKNKKKIAVLSRGYKRKSEGFLLANENTQMEDLGDEPFQFFSNHPDVLISVDADRVNGINNLLQLHPDIEVILLDDAYQHRKVQASFYALLTSFESIYSNDFLLPIGTLRESRNGAKRAKAIIITKCPKDLKEQKQNEIVTQINPLSNQKVYFSYIDYAKNLISNDKILPFEELKNFEVLLITGIANPKPLLSYLEESGIEYKHEKFADHYNFTQTDIENIKNSFEKISSENKIILTTEKDYMRLKGKLPSLYFIGIETKFLNETSKDFDLQILEEVD